MRRVTLRIDSDELAGAMDALATRNNRSLNGEIITAIQHYVAHDIRMRTAAQLDRERGIVDPFEED